MSNVRRVVGLAILGPLSLTLSGCGAILTGTRQQVKVGSEPAGATVRVDPAGEKAEFTTPATIALDKKSNYVLRFSAPGYADQQVGVEKHLRGGILVADILLTGLIGVVVDAATGGWNGLRPKDATITLKKTSASLDGPESIDVSMTHDVEHPGSVHVASSQPITVTIERR
jgi:hypothetical protein